jgi:hypothetical protein
MRVEILIILLAIAFGFGVIVANAFNTAYYERQLAQIKQQHQQVTLDSYLTAAGEKAK